MATNEQHSDLEVVSKEMSNGMAEDSVDSKLASPEDSPKGSISEADKTTTQIETSKMEENVSDSDSPSTNATLNDDNRSSSNITPPPVLAAGNISPEDYSTDPMLASALASPLHDHHPPNLDAIFSPTEPTRTRAPSILKQQHLDEGITTTAAVAAANDNDVWQLYKRAGPKYPPSLEKLIMKYHQKHSTLHPPTTPSSSSSSSPSSSTWQLAHDVGAGSGVYAPTLAKFFRHVHISDPSAAGLRTSREMLSSSRSGGRCSNETSPQDGSGKNSPRPWGRFTFSVGKPEEADTCVMDGSVDMVCLTESAHFTDDAETMVRSIAASLSPGGTLVMVTHRPLAQVIGNNQVREAVDRLFEAWGREPWEVACGEGKRARQQFGMGLDFVPLPEDLFKREETRRITINTRGKAHVVFRAPWDASEDDDDLKMSADEMMDLPTSRVDGREKRVEYSDEDEAGKGWRHEVGWESFRTRIAMFDGPERVKRLEPSLMEIQDLIMKTSPNGVKVVIEWAVAVVLATRK
ncbi:hypothetical protein KC343_g8868 [Hortaea werneckii]|uniref:Methyltransferase type 11 domain-containing protein n=1 Tax=Hortaea werneckii TaxID=91943 RepID=A0A3M7EUZ4_HORWE|nr:hypothetical protein KC352_g24077 [Hortaea werneckii]KAI7561382.1 hypothetical protein KC317_g9103 [Hortaea werneckii]KAI7610316.1 hypothetical protein KC346_g8782 [Hortaea werneckii]KAI7619035.1 hypothetical protein KC343_g8868 [Hortaea werneckii]KAI7660403.1 hypothetical protein KC319_g8678 [Hortaea werneckii]